MQFDNSMFGPFSVAMLEMIRDELPKIPVLAFPVISGTNPSGIDVDEVCNCYRKQISDFSVLNAFGSVRSKPENQYYSMPYVYRH